VRFGPWERKHPNYFIRQSSLLAYQIKFIAKPTINGQDSQYIE